MAQSGAAAAQTFRGPPLHLLVFAYQHVLTGTITIETEAGQEHMVYFHEGAPAKVLLADPVLTLDSILLRMGATDPAHLVEAVRLAYENGKLLGRFLVSRGLVSEETLDAALRWQVQEKIAHLMELSDRTHYHVQPAENRLASYGGSELSAVDPLAMIMVAVRLPASAPAVDRNAAQLKDLLLGLQEGAPVERLRCTAEESAVVLMLADGLQTVGSLVAAGHDERAVKNVLFALSSAQLVEEIEEVEEVAPPAAMPVAVQPQLDAPISGPQSHPGGYDAAPSLPAFTASTSSRPDPFWDEPLYEEPPVSQPAPGSYQPYDSHPPHDSYQPHASHAYEPQPDMDARDEAPTSSRGEEAPTSQRTMEALTAMRGAPAFRPEVKRSRRMSADPNEQPVSSRPSMPRSVPAPTSLAPPGQVVARVAVERQSVPPSSRRGQERPSNPSASEPPVSQRGQPAMSTFELALPVVDIDTCTAGEAYGVAEEALRVLDYARAELFAARAVALYPGHPPYRTTLAWVQAKQKPAPMLGNELQHYEDQIAVLTDVIANHPNFEQAYYYRARLYKRCRQARKAMEDFQMCTTLNPGNVDAARELREYQAKRKNRPGPDGSAPQPGKKGGLLNWLASGEWKKAKR